MKSIRHSDGGLYTCTHDYTGRLLSEKPPVQNAMGAQGMRYLYVADFNRIKTVYADGGAGYGYGYDRWDRLVSVTNPDGGAEHRNVYDPARNFIKDIPAKGCLTVDSNDDRIGTVYTYDLTGNVTSITYAYDGFGRATEVRMANGNGQIKRYDAEGLCAEMEENGQLIKFLFNGEKEVIAEEADDDVIRYIRGLGIISSDSESARTYYHYVSDNQ